MSTHVRRPLALLLAAVTFLGMLSVASTTAVSAPQHDSVVSAEPATGTPAVDDGSVLGIAQTGSTVVAVGSFTGVTPPGRSSVARAGAFAFNASSGALVGGFAPTFDGSVEDVLPGPTTGTVYVAGRFTRVNGQVANRIALLDVSTGQLVAGFSTPGINGVVNAITRAGNRLYAGGNFTAAGNRPHGGLAAFDATTGAIDHSLSVQVDGHHNDSGSGAQGAIGVRDLDAVPDGSRLVAIGNFKTVDGLPRDQLVVVDLGSSPVVAPTWRTRRYEPYCFNWAFDTYMRGVSVSPDGSYFVVATTGGPSAGTLCDAAARFEVGASGDDIQPTWVNASGGDTLWGVSVTETAVYVGGHQRWMNNSSGADEAAQGAVPRPGLAALNTETGVPISWNPGRNPRGTAVYALYPTATGLWMGSNTDWVGNFEYRRPKLAFFPLAGGKPEASDATPGVPGTAYIGGGGSDPSGASALRAVELTTRGAGSPRDVSDQGIDWTQVRGAFVAGGRLWYGNRSGDLRSRSFEDGALGAEKVVDPYDDPTWAGVDTGSGNTYDGKDVALYRQMSGVTGMAYADGRLYYTRSRNPNLYWRWFNTDSGIIGSEVFTANGGRSWRGTSGMFVAGGQLYFVSSDGTLDRIALTDGVPTGSPTTVDGPADSGTDWRGRALFLTATAALRENTAPTADFTVSCVDLTCDVDASGSADADGTIESYAWDFGGATAKGRTARHTFADPGTYAVTLTVTDDRSGTDTTTRQVTVEVTPPPEQPIRFVDAGGSAANVQSPAVTVPAGAEAGDLLLLTATVSSSPVVADPTGWTLVGRKETTGMTTLVWSRTAAAGDAGSDVRLTFQDRRKSALAVTAYRNVGAVGQTATVVDAATSTHSAPSVTVPNGSWVVWYFADKSPDTESWTGGTGVTGRQKVYSTGGGRVSAFVGDTAGPRSGVVEEVTARTDVQSSRGIAWSITLEARS
ncbi:PKD domain-containing protein [Phycicoccus sp. CSK15P-2]|uniref:PKD domain-containing protein n=1 Tax=Phycicoccus sp. CSK15P-2 TaxID=2807627 RepID=UPI0019520297|nr:PKD domain-containing protein [Phycicoccus sp. CSK15P-2]MBM6402712.1 PKD domain-containing protein [Phycicoccus sp. CSK15P-2]